MNLFERTKELIVVFVKVLLFFTYVMIRFLLVLAGIAIPLLVLVILINLAFK